VDAIFGPSSEETIGIVASMAEKFGIPHFVYHYDRKPLHWRKTQKRNLTLNFHPDADYLSEAFSNVLVDFDWNSYTIVYEKEEHLMKLKDVLQISDTDNVDRNRELNVGYAKLTDDYKNVLKKILNDGRLNVVLDISTQNIIPFLKEASEVGMLTEYTNYFVTNLDTHSLDFNKFFALEDVKIGSNITFLTLVKSKSVEKIDDEHHIESESTEVEVDQIPLEAALIHDAVQVFFNTLQMKPYPNKKQKKQKATCENPVQSKSSQAVGLEILSLMKEHIHEGMSGTIELNNDDLKYGSRLHFELDIIALSNKKFDLIGHWATTEKLKHKQKAEEVDKRTEAAIQSKNFTIAVRVETPFCMKVTVSGSSN
jgi:glutamate receptor, ionotropic, invertebrate